METIKASAPAQTAQIHRVTRLHLAGGRFVSILHSKGEACILMAETATDEVSALFIAADEAMQTARLAHKWAALYRLAAWHCVRGRQLVAQATEARKEIAR